ncbi:hypothetical protein PCE1_004753 [Barthelona sp. PCE]
MSGLLWVDKYRPTSLNTCSFHEDINGRLQQLSTADEFPHLLFYGPSGSGRKTRVLGLLKAIYGSAIDHVRLEERVFKHNTTKIQCSLLSSNHHIEINPSDHGTRDRIIVQEVIKEVAQSRNVIKKGDEYGFKVVVIPNIDLTTQLAQQALRRTMETSVGSCRLILIAENVSSVIEPLRSRCVCIRVPAPSDEIIRQEMRSVMRKEGKHLTDEVINEIVTHSQRNLRTALIALELTFFESNAPERMVHSDWEEAIKRIALAMLQKQNVQVFSGLRALLYELLVNCVPATIILQRMLRIFGERVPDMPHDMYAQLVEAAAQFEHSAVHGSNGIFHLEAFCAKAMAILKKVATLLGRSLL